MDITKPLTPLETRMVTAGRTSRYTQGSVNPVIQRASSIVFDSVQAKQVAIQQRHHAGLYYGRRGTLTHFAFQEAMVELEQGAGCVLYPCGSAAIANAILSFVGQGDHILVTGGAYEPTQAFCQKVLARLGVQTTFFDPLIGENITALLRPNTKLIFLESPSSITMEVQDVPTIVNSVRRYRPEMVIMLDNTWAAGVFFQPLRHGVDVSIQSGTKYICGHSDAMLGVAVANSRCWDTLREQSYLMGQMLDADSAYMAARGLRTLPVRLKQHQESALTIAHWLEKQTDVASVNHPALPSCKGHTAFLRDFSGSSGLFSFVLKRRLTDQELATFLDHFHYFHMAYSWGGFESLILAHQLEDLAAIRPAGEVDFCGTLIRLHIGLENVDDLIQDLNAGFARLSAG